jgi:predicted dehydrogenase
MNWGGSGALVRSPIMERIRIGQVGVANFGAYRRQAINDSGRFHLAALCDLNGAALSSAAAQEQATPYSKFHQMLRHPELQGIVICTSADSHADLALAAMRAGKHVFIEKPLCCSVQEVLALRQAAAQTGRIVGVGHDHCPSNPIYLTARAFIDEGRLGTVVAFEENSSHSGGLEIQPGDWRGLADRNPGGMLFQCGVHALHGLAYLFGSPCAIQASMRYDANPNTQTADAATVLLRYPGGLIGTLCCYHVTGYMHELRIFGTKGNLYFDTHLKQGWFQPRRRNEVEDRQPLSMPVESPTHRFANLLSWADGIQKGTRVYPGLEDGIVAVLPVFAAEKARAARSETDLALLMT